MATLSTADRLQTALVEKQQRCVRCHVACRRVLDQAMLLMSISLCFYASVLPAGRDQGTDQHVSR